MNNFDDFLCLMKFLNKKFPRCIDPYFDFLILHNTPHWPLFAGFLFLRWILLLYSFLYRRKIDWYSSEYWYSSDSSEHRNLWNAKKCWYTQGLGTVRAFFSNGKYKSFETLYRLELVPLEGSKKGGFPLTQFWKTFNIIRQNKDRCTVYTIP